MALVYKAPGPDQYGISYRGGWVDDGQPDGGAGAGGGGGAQAPGTFTQTPGSQAPNFKEFQQDQFGGPSPFEQTLPQPFDLVPQLPLGGFGGTSPSTGDFGTGSQRGQGWADFPGSYTGGGAPAGGADKNKSGEGTGGGGQGFAGTGPINVGAGEARRAQDAATTQRNEMLRQLFTRLFGGTGGAIPQVPTPPNLFGFAEGAIEAGRARQQQELANEAAATGAAGSRDLAYRQGVVGSQALEALGRTAPTWQSQQFTLASQQAQSEYQRQQAEFATMLRAIAAMGGGSFI